MEHRYRSPHDEMKGTSENGRRESRRIQDYSHTKRKGDDSEAARGRKTRGERIGNPKGQEKIDKIIIEEQ
jgi:hypothetical protein